jgi:glycosyltransferase involved in cell wall biosynthesis
VPVKTIRNVSYKNKVEKFDSKTELGLPEDKKIIILQGAFINVERGAEEAVLAMQYVDGAILLIIGGGDVFDKLRKMAVDLDLTPKVKFVDKVPYHRLMHYTVNATIGLSLDKNTNLNYKYSLPNKLFDYIQAGVPVLVSNLVEPKKIVSEYNIGEIIESHDPKHIAEKMMYMLSATDKIEIWKTNLKKAAEVYCWENEEKNLLEIYKEIIN